MRLSARATVVVLMALLMATPAWAKAGGKGNKGQGPGFKKPKPGFTLETKKKKKKTAVDQTEESIRASIENQKQILELEDPAEPKYPEMVIALADFYWDLSEIYDRRQNDDDLLDKLTGCEDRKDTKCVAAVKAKLEGLADEMRIYQGKTVETYQDVLAKYPSAPKLDEVRYFLAYHLSLMGRDQESTEVYKQLIQENPDSVYVPDALVNVGEYYFQINDFGNALKLYEAAEHYETSPVYAYAIYKQGWCHYNMGNYDISLDRLLKVLKVAESHHKSLGVETARQLAKQARNDLVLPYAKIGKPSAAIAFFKRYAPDSYLNLCSRLAGIYTDETDYGRSNKLLRRLIKEARKPPKKGGKDLRYMVIRFQRQIVDNANRAGNKKATVAEIAELVRLYKDLRGKAPQKFLAKEADGMDQLILIIATGYHNEFKTTKEQKTLDYTRALYATYLELFADRPNAYDIRYNVGLLSMMTGKFEEAGVQFEKLIDMQPTGKYADDAAEWVVLARLRSIQVKTGQVKTEAKDDLKPVALSADAAGFIHAVDRWFKVLKAKGVKTDKQRDNIPKALFISAKLYYDANHFDEASKRFIDFLDKYPKHDLARDAARSLLSCYNLSHDADNLEKWARTIEKKPNWLDDDMRENIARIKRELDFMACFKPEKEHRHLAAAKCFLRYSKEHSDSDKAPNAVFNAAANYFNAKQVEKAIKTQQYLYSHYGKTELGPKALYAIAEIFRNTTVYDQAANIYEHFFRNHPKHELARKALQYAAIFRKTLGQYDAAVEDLNTYLKRFPKDENAARVHLDIILIREKQERPKYVLAAVKKHYKKFKGRKGKPGEPAGIHLRVMGAQGKALRELKKYKDAAEVFRATVDYFQGLDEAAVAKLGMKAISAVAEAHFNLGKTVLRKAKAIKLKGSEKKVQAALTKKMQLIKETKDIYNGVIRYGHPGWTIAAYTQLGATYRNLADTVENAEPPRRIRRDPMVVEEYKTMMAEKAEKIRAKAIESYHTALDTARKAHWFNEYSEKAEQAIAQLDLSDPSIKEYRLRPDHTGPNRSLPDFKQEVK